MERRKFNRFLKEGKYQFKYHINGKPHFVYSWRLEPTDTFPVGKNITVGEMVETLQRKRRYSTIKTVRSVLHPAFQMAVGDDVLMKNPFGFEMATVVVNDSVTREAITKNQMRKFLKFVHDGYAGFLFTDKNGYPEVAMHWEH